MKVNSMIDPLGIDRIPVFSWNMNSDKKNVMQTEYRLKVSEHKNLNPAVWDSGIIKSDESVGIKYNGQELKPSTRYYWNVVTKDNYGNMYYSDTAWFETGLMGTERSVWSGAEWIGNPAETENTAAVSTYAISVDITIECGHTAGIAVNARNKDNYVLIEFNMYEGILKVLEYSDDAWGSGESYIKILKISDIPQELISYSFKTEILSNETGNLTVKIDDIEILNEDKIVPANKDGQPRKNTLMSIGFKQESGRAIYRNLIVKNLSNGITYQNDDLHTDKGIMSILGETSSKGLTVENSFELACPVPAVNLKKVFMVDKRIKSARLYASARGFYYAYINGRKVGKDFYNPGFTDYRKRIQYQTYDITDMLKHGENVVGAIVGKGYYSGFCGYSGAQIYGKENSFICKMVISYDDGTEQTVVTDKTWQFTDKGPVTDNDYLDGEAYDARLELDWFDDSIWRECGVKPWPQAPTASNGILNGEEFELCSQMGYTARVETELNSTQISENPKGHIIYDMGQNMVGTIKLTVKGKAGKSIKIRYGEMITKDKKIYIKNLRTAANTDVYTLKGDVMGETFTPLFSSHGFRYVDITGNGYILDKKDIEIIEIKGLVIHNLGEMTGSFECSDNDINRLQKNIQWGQRGNSLLVLTDCPQRNERMGWTGDAQIFARTGAYNIDTAAFTEKWLQDLADSQLMYNKNGAVPDTAPLGGDNRPDGCGGWGDAAVIVPWELYRAYGDMRILEECYDMMKKWVDYQSREDRQNYGMRTVDGEEVPDKSDLASIPFIQIQQRRGDHLAFDGSTPYILSATAYAAHSADLLAQTAYILGKNNDAKKYRKIFENIKKAFNEAWVQNDGTLAYWGEMSEKNPQGKVCKSIDGSISRYTYYSDNNGSDHHPSQTAYALAIDFNLIPEDKLAGAAKAFEQSICRQNGKLTAGFLGVSHLAPALSKAGCSQMAFRLLEQRENPGWLYSVINGATTIWERWDSYNAETGKFGDVAMNSFNHYAYGAVGEWIFGNVLGIRPDKPGYKSIILSPEYGGSLKYAKGSYMSQYGLIISNWEIKENKFIYECRIPANTTATLYLPSEKVYEEPDGVSCIMKNNKKTVYALGSGRYLFKAYIS